MTDPTDKRIEELRQYIPPYTAPNHPPQVEVITTTNTGDTPMSNPLDRMRAESDWLKAELTLRAEIERLRNERDEARRLYCIAFQEITENLGEKNTTESIAEEMGWDCYKENTNKPWSAEKHDAIARQIKDTVNEITENTRKAVPQKIDIFKENS